MRLGIVSDTHGLMRPEALEALTGCERIIHAGDVGKPVVLEALSRIAPLDVVRGNIDRGDWMHHLPDHKCIEWHGLRIFLLHDISAFQATADAAYDLVIAGHSHRPFWGYVDGIRHLNPGSIGPKRFRLPVTLACIQISAGFVRLQKVVLDDRGGSVDWGPGCGMWPYEPVSRS